MVCLFCVGVVLVIVGVVVLRYYLDDVRVENLDKKSVFITGCDCGFGLLLALRLAREGMRVFAGCLTEKGQKEIQEKGKSLRGKIDPILVNVTDQYSMDEAFKTVESKLGGQGLWAVVCNAGVLGQGGFSDWLTVRDYQSAFDVNTLGVIRTSETFKPLVKKAHGRIVIISSIAGRLAFATAGPYSVSKFGVDCYGDVLRRELRDFGCKVAILEPGFFRTGLLDLEAARERMEMLWKEQPKRVVEEYGEDFFDKYFERYKKQVNMASSNLDLVVQLYWACQKVVYGQ